MTLARFGVRAGSLAARRAIGDEVAFAAWDQEMNAAAARDPMPLALE